jgi:hypothetical protein
MKIDVPGCAAVGWLCTLLQEWPSARGRPPGAVHQGVSARAVHPCHPPGGLAICRRSADLDIRPDARAFGRVRTTWFSRKTSKVTTLHQLRKPSQREREQGSHYRLRVCFLPGQAWGQACASNDRGMTGRARARALLLRPSYESEPPLLASRFRFHPLCSGSVRNWSSAVRCSETLRRQSR